MLDDSIVVLIVQDRYEVGSVYPKHVAVGYREAVVCGKNEGWNEFRSLNQREITAEDVGEISVAGIDEIARHAVGCLDDDCWLGGDIRVDHHSSDDRWE